MPPQILPLNSVLPTHVARQISLALAADAARQHEPGDRLRRLRIVVLVMESDDRVVTNQPSSSWLVVVPESRVRAQEIGIRLSLAFAERNLLEHTTKRLQPNESQSRLCFAALRCRQVAFSLRECGDTRGIVIACTR